MKKKIVNSLLLVVISVALLAFLDSGIIGLSIIPLVPAPPLSSSTLSVSRSLPDTVDRNVEYDATLSVVGGAKPPVSATINEYVPLGWNVTSSSPEYSSYDPVTGKLSWLLMGSLTMDITYTFKVPGDASGTVEFAGNYTYNDPDTGNSTTKNVTGESSVSVSEETTTSTTSTTSTSTTVEGSTTTTVATIVGLSRDMQDSVESGKDLGVTLSLVEGDNPPNAVTINEYVPSGWSVTDSNPTHDSYNSETGEISWVFFSFNFYTRDITYTVSVPAGASGTATLSGEYSYNHPDTGESTTETTSGDTSIDVIGVTTTSTTTTTVEGTTTSIPSISLTRDLPSLVYAGDSMNGVLELVKGEDAPNSVIIYEYIPSGWNVTATNPTPDESGDGLIKWLFWGSTFYSRDLTYSLEVPVDANGTVAIDGAYLYNENDTPMNQTTAGDNSTLVKSTATLAVSVNRSFTPGSATTKAGFSVTLDLDLLGTAPDSVTLVDNFPAGWNVTASSPEATSKSPSTGRIEWLLDNVTDRNVTYSLKVPSGTSTGVKTFTGEFTYLEDSANVTSFFGGETNFTVAESPGLATIARDLPDSAEPGSCIEGLLDLSMENVSVVILSEYIPEGWNLSSSSPAYTSFSSALGRVRWTLGESRNVSYSSCSPSNDTEGGKEFTGTFSYSTSDISVVDSVSGDTSITISSVPGDTNGDGEVSDFELLSYINEWSEGEVGDFDLLEAINEWSG